MYDHHTKTQFIELRAQGRSLARIALDLDISKRTAVDWNRQFQTEIVSLREFELEAIHEKFALTFERELSHLAKQQNAVEQELATRDFRRVPTEKLLRLSLMLRRQIQDLRPSCCETPLASSPEPTIAPAQPETPVDPLSAEEPSGGESARETPATEVLPTLVNQPPPLAADSQLSAPNEQPVDAHCPECASVLPALLPSGERPDQWCRRCGCALPEPASAS